MDIKQLRYFIAIAEEKKITAAAERLHIAQPPLSQQLKSMEKELGVLLVERKGKTLELTEAGKDLYEKALTIVKLMEETESDIKEIGEGSRGKLSIGVNTLSEADMPGLLMKFSGSFPRVSFKIHQADSPHLASLLKERKIEIAFVRLPLNMPGLEMLQLKTEPFVLVAPRTIPIASDEGVTLAEVNKHPLILPSIEGLGIYQMILNEFSRQQLEPKVYCECSDIRLSMEFVAAGIGVTIIPESVLSLYRNYPVQHFRISEDNLFSASALVWDKNHYLSKAAQNFMGMVKEFYGGSI